MVWVELLGEDVGLLPCHSSDYVVRNILSCAHMFPLSTRETERSSLEIEFHYCIALKPECDTEKYDLIESMYF